MFYGHTMFIGNRHDLTNLTISPTLSPPVTMDIVRDKKIRSALRTNLIVGLVTAPCLEKNKDLYLLLFIAVASGGYKTDFSLNNTMGNSVFQFFR